MVGLSHLQSNSVHYGSFFAGKQTNRFAKLDVFYATAVGDVIYSDVYGPLPCLLLGGTQYFVTFIDEMPDIFMIFLSKLKRDGAGAFQKFPVWFEREYDFIVKFLHSDGGEST